MELKDFEEINEEIRKKYEEDQKHFEKENADISGAADISSTLVFLKCQYDPFYYALRTITGEIIIFECATRYGDWLSIEGVKRCGNLDAKEFPRGLDIRISSIVWMADDFHGE